MKPNPMTVTFVFIDLLPVLNTIYMSGCLLASLLNFNIFAKKIIIFAYYI